MMTILVTLTIWCFLAVPVSAWAEPVAQIPLGEFKVMLSNVDRLQKREKLYIEKDKIAEEKDRLQTDYIAKMEAADEQREKYVEKLEQIANDPRWAQRAQDWATASGVTSAVLYLGRKLILKF